jgi:hypothetical protein
MHKLINALSDWPGLVQALVAAAVFWGLLNFGTFSYRFVTNHVNRMSRKRTIRRLSNQLWRYKAFKSYDDISDPYRAAYPALLLYRASGDAIRGLIWLTLGLVTQSFLPIFGVIGFAGCLLYLFGALEVVAPVPYEITDVDEKIVDLSARIDRLTQDLLATGPKRGA